ncbi:MAG TPA: acyltransferase, partial [Myxococcaceae bacterium]|nr:acyltransferase [Myxococcaceae bacterium]
PVVDTHRWPGIDLFVGFNDIFFMSLMFLVSGLFVWPSLERKGAGRFLGDRLRRLGIPFLVSAAFLAPLAYFPSYLQAGGTGGVSGFWQIWRGLPSWSAGPAWFLWVLLVFGAVAAALSRLAPGWADALGRFLGRFQRPAGLFGLLVLVSAAGYLPLAIGLGPVRWLTWGPFVVQASRPLLYAVYFFAGAGLGAYGLDRGVLARGGLLGRRWPAWVLASLGAFLLCLVFFLVALSRGEASGAGTWAAVDVTFVLSCAASSFALLALFVRFARQGRVGDSLSANAYGIYLVHYPVVSWLQYALLGSALSGAAKGSLVFAGAVVLSWGATAFLRRIPAFGRVLSTLAPRPAPEQAAASK